MISNTEKALYAFWKSFELVAYKQGEVPDNARLPYITYSVEDGELSSSNILTAYVWAKQDSEGFKIRRNTLDLIAQAIPESGVRLASSEKSTLILYRNANWLSIGKDDISVDVIYGRVSYMINYY